MLPSFMDATTWVILSIFLFGLTFVAKKIVEFLLANKLNTSKNADFYKKLWSDLILPILPFVLGMIFGFFITSYPYPEEFKGVFSKMAYMSSSGLFSGLVVRVVKAAFKLKITQSDPSDNSSDSIG